MVSLNATLTIVLETHCNFLIDKIGDWFEMTAATESTLRNEGNLLVKLISHMIASIPILTVRKTMR